MSRGDVGLQPAQRLSGLSALVRSRELIWIWTRREIRVRYKHAVLGALWAVLQPLALMGAFVLLSRFLPRLPARGVPYPVFFYAALLPWTFFASAVTFASTSLIQNMPMITKAAFPREILPLASVGAALFDFVVAAAVFVLLLLAYRQPITASWAWIPVLLAVQVGLGIGLGLVCSGLVALFRDLRFAVPIALQILLFATPVVYSLDSVPAAWRPLVMANPMAGVVQGWRQATVFAEAPDPRYLGWAALCSAALLVAGLALFRRISPDLADRI